MEIKIRKMMDGRFEAQYFNKVDPFINGICQYGMTGFEAQINLQALLNAIKREQLRIGVIFVNDL